MIVTLPLVAAMLYFAPGLREAVGLDSKAAATRPDLTDDASDAAFDPAWTSARVGGTPTHYVCTYHGTQWDVAYEHHAGTPEEALQALEIRVTAGSSDFLPDVRDAFDAPMARTLRAARGDGLDAPRSRRFSNPGTGALLMAMAFDTNDGESILMTMRSRGNVNPEALLRVPSPDALRREIEEYVSMPAWAEPTDKIENATEAFRVTNYFVDNAESSTAASIHYQTTLNGSERNLAHGSGGYATQVVVKDGVEIALSHADVPGTVRSTTIIKIKTWLE